MSNIDNGIGIDSVLIDLDAFAWCAKYAIEQNFSKPYTAELVQRAMEKNPSIEAKLTKLKDYEDARAIAELLFSEDELRAIRQNHGMSDQLYDSLELVVKLSMHERIEKGELPSLIAGLNWVQVHQRNDIYPRVIAHLEKGHYAVMSPSVNFHEK